MTRLSGRVRRFAALVLMTAIPAMAAQGQYGHGGGGGSRQGGGQMHMPDPILFTGPPVPEDFLDLVGLDSAEYGNYRVLYTNFVNVTQQQRDSLAEWRRRAREAMGSWQGDQGGHGGHGGQWSGGSGAGHSRPSNEAMDAVRKTLDDLDKKQKEFDEALKPMLTEPQYKHYEAWRAEERAKAEREMRDRFGGGRPPN